MNFLIIWDIDGTLINIMGVGKKSLSDTFYKIYDIKDAFENVQMIGAMDLKLLQGVLKLNNIEENFIPSANNSNNLLSVEAKSFFDEYSKVLQSNVDKINTSIAAPGVLELMKALKKYKNIYNCLGTGNAEVGARIKLSVDNLNEYFPTGGFGDDALERAHLIELAIERSSKTYGVSFDKNNIFVIGDTTRDIEAGLKVGVKTIGVATGPHSTETLLESGADYVFQNLTDIDSFLDIFK